VFGCPYFKWEELYSKVKHLKDHIQHVQGFFSLYIMCQRSKWVSLPLLVTLTLVTDVCVSFHFIETWFFYVARSASNL
jgi:hypothetical protein